MEIPPSHPSTLAPRQAFELQRELAQKVVVENCLGEVRTVAGVDVGIKGGEARAAVVVLEYPSLQPIDQATANLPVEMPYIPGLLAFREGPAILEALRQLSTVPDCLIFDGQGLAHPRRLGIASHIGVLLDRPSIGCAKSRLCGIAAEPAEEAGSYTFLYDGEEVIGAAVRTRTRVSPVYVSIGHRVDLETAIKLVLNCCRGRRLPETSRLAHRVAGGEGLVIRKDHPEQLNLL